MSDVAAAHARDRKRYREYERTRGSSDGWDAPEPRASFDADPSDMSDDQLRKQHDTLLRLQKQELTAGHDDMAQRMARRRNELWTEADTRGIADELG